jgi:hypothetical protein
MFLASARTQTNKQKSKGNASSLPSTMALLVVLVNFQANGLRCQFRLFVRSFVPPFARSSSSRHRPSSSRRVSAEQAHNRSSVFTRSLPSSRPSHPPPKKTKCSKEGGLMEGRGRARQLRRMRPRRRQLLALFLLVFPGKLRGRNSSHVGSVIDFDSDTRPGRRRFSTPGQTTKGWTRTMQLVLVTKPCISRNFPSIGLQKYVVDTGRLCRQFPSRQDNNVRFALRLPFRQGLEREAATCCVQLCRVVSCRGRTVLQYHVSCCLLYCSYGAVVTRKTVGGPLSRPYVREGLSQRVYIVRHLSIKNKGCGASIKSNPSKLPITILLRTTTASSLLNLHRTVSIPRGSGSGCGFFDALYRR